MTTVVLHNNKLYADRKRSTNSYFIEGDKICFLDENTAVVWAGPAGIIDLVTTIVNSPREPVFYPSRDKVVSIFYCVKGQCPETWTIQQDMKSHEWSLVNRFRIESKTTGSGSGYGYARGALLAGADILDALDIAVMLDNYSGFGFDVLDLTDFTMTKIKGAK